MDAALDDAEQAVTRSSIEGGRRPRRPAHRQPHGFGGVGLARRIRRAFIEDHGDIGAESVLDFDRALGRQFMPGAVEMGLEDDAVIGDLAEIGQRHDLETARIGEDRSRPVHEPVQSAEPGDDIGARAQHQMIGVGEHDLGPGRGHRFGRHRLDGPGGADGDEGRGGDGAVGASDLAQARRTRTRPELETEAALIHRRYHSRHALRPPSPGAAKAGSHRRRNRSDNRPPWRARRPPASAPGPKTPKPA